MASLWGTGPEEPEASIHVPVEWTQAAERIARDGIRSVAVIGPVDAGKSTFCRYALSIALQAGRNAALLDTDIGQKTIGPPACVTMGTAHGLSLAFVGTTDPVRGWTPLIEGTHRLARHADVDLLIANTGGLLAGPGRRLKADEIAALAPDLLIALGEGAELETILADHSQTAILRLPRSPEARRKPAGERRAARREAFRRYFRDASTSRFEPALLERLKPRLLPERLLLGLSDARGSDLGLGILLGLTESGMMDVLTPALPALVGRIVPGSLCLGETFSETRPSLEQPVPDGRGSCHDAAKGP